MKAAMLVFFLAISGVVMRAQTKAASGDVTLKMSAGSPEYCVGSSIQFFVDRARGPNDIVLRLPLKLWYENHQPERIILPYPSHNIVSATVAGQSVPISERNRSGGGSPNEFIVLEKAELFTGPDLVQCLSSTDRGCMSDFVPVPVLDLSSGLDLRGKTVQIKVLRDHSLPQQGLEKLKENVKGSGTVWTGVVESETMTFRISDEPPTRDCRIPLPK